MTRSGILAYEVLIHENCFPKILDFVVQPLTNGEFIAFDLRRKEKQRMPMTKAAAR
jgi:hypothetical protein